MLASAMSEESNLVDVESLCWNEALGFYYSLFVVVRGRFFFKA